jgi:anti-sigma regulatory factor (Ser/Thr protein kinase)
VRSSRGSDACFSHEALFYDGADGFLEGTVPFIREALDANEPVLVAVPADKVELLRGTLNGESAGVLFADMTSLGRNPARIIPAWRDFVDEHPGPVRGIGEPIWAGRSPAELTECQRHESLLNLAFDGDPRLRRLLCPYDATALEDDVLEEARRSHPHLWEGGAPRASGAYSPPAPKVEADEELPPPPSERRRLTFARDDVSTMRHLVAARARAAGLTPQRASDLVLATSEAATNSVLHGGGGGTLAVWEEPGALVCEVRDRGHIEDPLVGRERPALDAPCGRGLWLLNQVCDLVELRSPPGGCVVRFRMALA